jgi:hypothetical protein
MGHQRGKLQLKPRLQQIRRPKHISQRQMEDGFRRPEHNSQWQMEDGFQECL